jgi:hypothetical protein
VNRQRVHRLSGCQTSVSFTSLKHVVEILTYQPMTWVKVWKRQWRLSWQQMRLTTEKALPWSSRAQILMLKILQTA